MQDAKYTCTYIQHAVWGRRRVHWKTFVSMDFEEKPQTKLGRDPHIEPCDLQ